MPLVDGRTERCSAEREKAMTATTPSNLGSVLRGRAAILKGATLSLCISVWGVTACSGAPQVDNPVGQSSGGGNAGGVGGGTASAASTTKKTAVVPRGGSSGLVINLGQGGGTDDESAGGASSANPIDDRTIDKKCAETSDVATDIVTVQPADIVFAIDGSSSMAQETQFVREQMNEFSRKIMDSGIDVRVIVIAAESGGAGGAGGAASTTASTATAGRPAFPGGPGGFQRETFGICIDAPLGSGQCPNDENLPNYAHVPTLVDSKNSLNLFISTYPEYKDHLRPEASKSLVVVTDDDSTDRPNNSAATFTQNFTALDPELLETWTFNGVFCFTQCTEAAAIGAVYADLVSQTDGVSGDLCLQDFKPVFDRLAEQIIQKSGSEIECEWVLPEREKDQTFSPSLVEAKRVDSEGTTTLGRVASMEQCGDNGGWYFDSNLNPTKILACDSSCRAMQNTDGGGIEISFGCESVASCVASDSSALNTDSCSWPLPNPPSGQDLVISSVNVRYTSASGFATDIGRVESSSECENVEEGWYYDDPKRPTKVLACSQTCKQIQAGGEDSSLEVLFGCETAKAPIVVL